MYLLNAQQTLFNLVLSKTFQGLSPKPIMWKKFEEIKKNVQEEKFVPSVIEPSFGIGRILFSVFEHSFKMRDEKRTYLSLPPRIAPVKCSILTV